MHGHPSPSGATLRRLLPLTLAVWAALAATPASASGAFGLSKLTLNSKNGKENYQYTAGNTVHAAGTADVPSSAAPNRRYRLLFRAPGGATRASTACARASGNGTVSSSYTVASGDPPSTGAMWTAVLEQYADTTCMTLEKTSSLPFAVAQASAFPTAALTAPQAFFGAGATAYVRLAGLTPEGGDWSTTWQQPNGATACANTVGADRPEAGADGALPSLAGDFLQYQPGSAGSEWNLQAKYDGACPVATTQGAWRVLVERDATHFVTLTAFSVDPKAPASSAASPQHSQSSALTVSYTASDSGGAGLATVDLYAKGPGDLGFTKVATDSAPGVSGSFSYLAAGGDGNYGFYTVATDSAGNVEPVPSTSDSTTVVDGLAPTSIGASPPYSTSPSITVSYTAADLTVDGGGLAKVELYARGPGDAAFTPVAVDSTPGATGSFSYTASAGDGSYGFFTVATDGAGNVEAAPAGADSTTVVDTAAPASAASAPPSSSAETFTIAYEAADPGPTPSGLAAVELYAKGPADSDYAKASTDGAPGSSGSFTYTAGQGTGSYSFYTVATDRAGNGESPPATADTVTTVDTVVDGTPPASAAGSPEYARAATWSVSYTASDEGTGASGLARVELYAKGPGDVGYSRAATEESPGAAGTFAYAAGDGDGDYAFYTVATDRAGNVEAAPANADTSTRLDRGAPNSSASAPASSTVSTFDVSYTATDAGAAASGVATVELYAKGPGEAGYSKAGTATTGAGTLTYSATRGSGSYSFYTVATDRAGNVESPPSGADATTAYDPIDVATLYVAKNNTNCTDSGSGTAARPFCSIRPAATKATAGQTVRVSEGTYGEVVSVANSGTATAPVTFVSAPGENVTVAGGTSGFSIVAKSYVTVEGFTVTGTSGDGIVVRESSNITVRGNRVTKSGQPVTGLGSKGIRVENTSDSLIADNTVDHNTNYGIYLIGSTRNEVVGNRAFANARQYERAASGIRVYVSTGNTVASNLSYHNEDSGIELVNTAHGNLVVNNIAYGNGDHGIDVTQSSLDARLIANSVHTSVTSGLNVEVGSTGASLFNNVAVDNAVNSPRGTGNIRVDATSASGVTIDYNLVWQTGTGRNYEWKGLGYNTIEQMRTVSGQEAHGIQANPRWASPAEADFSLTPGSPAIDSANSGASGQLSSDGENRPRLDDPGTPNSGVGPRAYDDRGALEYEAGNRPPVAGLTVSPSSGTVDLAVTADASASVDNDGIAAIAGYTFDWGDGSTATGPQAEPNAAHTYRAAGTYTVTVTVTDTAGASAHAQSTVTVSDDPPQAALVVTPGSGGAPLDVLADASGSTDTDGTPIARYRFDWGDGSTATGPQSGATARHTYAATGTYTVTVAVEDTAGQTSYATATVVVHGDNVPPTATLSVTPTSGPVDLDVTADASASTDPDDGIAGYSFAWGDGTPASGPQSQPTATHTYRAAGTYTITVTVTDVAGGKSTATAKVTVEDFPPAARLSLTPASGLAPLDVTADASGSTDADATPIATYSFDWGDGAPVSGPQPGATATHTYTAAGTYTVTVTVKDTAGQSSTATAQVSARPNLVANPGFETNLTGWNTSGSGVGATLTRVAEGHSGSWAAKLTNTGTAAVTCTLNDSPDWARTTVAGTYTGALWVRSDTAGATLRLRFREYSASVNMGSALSVATLTGSWQKLSVSYTVAAPGSTLDFNAYVTSAAPGTCFYADDVVVHLN